MKNKFILTFIITAIIITTIAPATAAIDTLTITNLSNITYNFTYQQLAEMPKTNVFADLYCYGNIVTSGDWSGIQLSYLLNLTDTTTDVNSIQLTAADSYTVSIPIQVAQAPQTIIAYQKDGVPLSEGLRLVLPGSNGASWIAQIVSITMSNNEAPVPPSLSADGNMAKGLLTNFNDFKVTPPTPTSAPTASPTPKPTPNITSNPTVPPVNSTAVEPTPKQQTVTNESINLDGMTIVTLAVVVAVGLAVATMLTYKRRTKLKTASSQQ